LFPPPPILAPLEPEAILSTAYSSAILWFGLNCVSYEGFSVGFREISAFTDQFSVAFTRISASPARFSVLFRLISEWREEFAVLFR
jgi:hypothetical protein